MTLDPRPAGAYLHGVNGPIAIVNGRVAEWILTHTDLDRLRKEHRGADPEIDAGLIDLTRAALSWRTSAGGSTGGSGLDPAPEVPPPSEVMSTGQAAQTLGITPRAVCLAIAEQRLTAEQVDGRWQITRTALELFRARRAA